MQTRAFWERFTSRPFLLALLDFFKNGGAVILLMHPDFPPEKVNALVGLAGCGTLAIATFMGFELNKDATIAKAQSQMPENVTAGGDVNVSTPTRPTDEIPETTEWREEMPGDVSMKVEASAPVETVVAPLPELAPGEFNPDVARELQARAVVEQEREHGNN
jgi:hypothetical protein